MKTDNFISQFSRLVAAVSEMRESKVRWKEEKKNKKKTIFLCWDVKRVTECESDHETKRRIERHTTRKWMREIMKTTEQRQWQRRRMECLEVYKSNNYRVSIAWKKKRATERTNERIGLFKLNNWIGDCWCNDRILWQPNVALTQPNDACMHSKRRRGEIDDDACAHQAHRGIGRNSCCLNCRNDVFRCKRQTRESRFSVAAW